MPGQRKVLASLIIKEIIYRLLSGGQGARLSHILALGGDTRRMSKAIGHLREHFDEQLKMEDIARELGMSVSGFHHNFRSVTSMSPLQFQKHLRLPCQTANARKRIAEVGTKIFSSVRVLRHRAFNQQIGYFLVRYEKVSVN